MSRGYDTYGITNQILGVVEHIWRDGTVCIWYAGYFTDGIIECGALLGDTVFCPTEWERIRKVTVVLDETRGT